MKPLLLTALSALFISAASYADDTKPNIVVIMADDIGLGDIGYYVRARTQKEPLALTPNIDRLIDEGMRFSDAHSPASLCAPTRFSMLTGNYTYRNAKPFGAWTPWSDVMIDPNFTTSGRIAKAGGYNTAFFGKWGCGGSWKTRKADWSKQDAGALTYGFDYTLELPEGIQNIPFAFYENQQWMKIKPDSKLIEISAVQTGYSTSKKHKDRGGMGDSNWDPTQAGPILANKAVEYIEKQAAEKSGKPFFMYYCSQAVHIPHTPVKELDGVKIAGSTPGIHGDMIVELDTQVGMIVKALKKQGLYKNTLLIFTSDNGGLSFDRDMKKAGHVTSNGLNGSKGSIYEGGHRVPFVAVWPGKIKPNTESKEPIVGHDVVATIATVSGQKIDRKKVMDSANLLPYFLGTTDSKAHSYLIHQSKGQRASGGSTFAIRDGEWKLIMKSSVIGELDGLKPHELYNLDKGLYETAKDNQIGNPEYSELVKKMFAKYQELRKSGAPTVPDLPTPTPTSPPESN